MGEGIAETGSELASGIARSRGDAKGGAVVTLGATYGRDFGCFHSLSAVPWDTPRAFRSASWWHLGGAYMNSNKQTTTPKQQEQQQEQLQEHQQQGPATNGNKQLPCSDTSRASAALSSASPSFIAQVAGPSCAPAALAYDAAAQHACHRCPRQVTPSRRESQ